MDHFQFKNSHEFSHSLKKKMKKENTHKKTNNNNKQELMMAAFFVCLFCFKVSERNQQQE